VRTVALHSALGFWDQGLNLCTMAAFWREVWLLYVLVAHLLNKNFFVLPATPGLKHKRSNNNCCLLHEEMLYRTFHSNTLLCSALDLAPQHSIETAYLLTHFFPFFFVLFVSLVIKISKIFLISLQQANLLVTDTQL